MTTPDPETTAPKFRSRITITFAEEDASNMNMEYEGHVTIVQLYGAAGFLGVQADMQAAAAMQASQKPAGMGLVEASRIPKEARRPS